MGVSSILRKIVIFFIVIMVFYVLPGWVSRIRMDLDALTQRIEVLEQERGK